MNGSDGVGAAPDMGVLSTPRGSRRAKKEDDSGAVRDQGWPEVMVMVRPAP